MEVYLVQHAEATSKQEDPLRPITEAGRHATADVAVVAAKLGLAVQQIRHSGKLRAEQTANVLAEALAPPDGVVQMDGLAPLDDVAPVADELARMFQPVMLVGHLPFMERLAGALLTGDPEQAVVKFTNAAIVCLSLDTRWQVTWILTPEMAAI
ncbi:MAG: phosphohistidine phosphatase SixA [Anaerolineae bacterium]